MQRGFGSGLLNSAAFVALTATIDRDQVAMAASTFFLSANGGMAVGMASASAVLQSGLRSGLEARLGDIPDRALVRCSPAGYVLGECRGSCKL